jgi:Ca-activated chloride channel family protein
MITLRKVINLGAVLMLLFTAACGGAATRVPAATEAPAYDSSSGYAAATSAPTEAPAADAFSAAPSPGQYFPTAVAPKSSQKPYDMFFEENGVNPSIDTEDDNLSTFALDVDTGSYTIARSYLQDGNLPPSESVRVEEYVNYFDQGYPNPPAHQAFGISIDGAPSPFTVNERYEMIRIGLQGYQVPEEERKDASLVFVIDVSGSMGMDNRLGLVKRSLELLVEQLRPTDQVAIVVYGTQAHIVLDSTPGSSKRKILSAIYSLEPEGVTNAEAGLRLGYQVALRNFLEDGINRLILCSDGVANTGQTEADAILAEVRGYVEEGVTLTTVGFGMDNYNDTLMEQLADNGDGFYAYVDDMTEAERLFVDKITGTLQTIAMNAKVQVEFNPEAVARYRLVGFENRAIADDQFRDNSVDAGEIGAGHSVTALYEVKLRPDAFGRIATVFMRWEDPDTHAVVEISKEFNAEEMERDFHRASPYFQRSVIVAEFAEILKQSYWAEGSSLSDVYREAERLSEYLPHDETWSEFVDLARIARNLE